MAKQTFTALQVLTAAQQNALQANDYNQTVSTKTASYTLVAADVGTKIVMNSATATTITVNTSLFSAGDTLTILNIAAGVCTVTAGTATVSSVGSLALAQYGGGSLYFTSAGVSVFQADGVIGGKVLQVVQNTFSTSTTTTSTSFVTSGLNATITPSLATSKVLIFTSQAYEMTTAGENAYQTLFRGTVAGTNLATANFGLQSVNATYVISQQSMTFLDSPNTTAAQIYTSGMKVSGGTLKAQIANSTGVMILMEIGA